MSCWGPTVSRARDPSLWGEVAIQVYGVRVERLVCTNLPSQFTEAIFWLVGHPRADHLYPLAPVLRCDEKANLTTAIAVEGPHTAVDRVAIFEYAGQMSHRVSFFARSCVTRPLRSWKQPSKMARCRATSRSGVMRKADLLSLKPNRCQAVRDKVEGTWA